MVSLLVDELNITCNTRSTGLTILVSAYRNVFYIVCLLSLAGCSCLLVFFVVNIRTFFVVAFRVTFLEG